jgi:hypothetical protein
MHILETLARVENSAASPLAPLIQEQRYRLAWGATLIVISGGIGGEVLDELYQARRSGQNAVLILSGRDTADEAARRRAAAFGIPVFSIADESDLNLRTQAVRSS